MSLPSFRGWDPKTNARIAPTGPGFGKINVAAFLDAGIGVATFYHGDVSRGTQPSRLRMAGPIPGASFWMRAAGPVFKLLGKQDLRIEVWPTAKVTIFHDLGCSMHDGGHGMVPAA